MEFKGSKGKWRTTFNSVKERGVRSVGGFVCFLPKPKHYEGQDQRYEDELIEVKANADLIAASKELLKELSNMVECWDNDTFQDIDIEEARKAIESATNQPSPS